MRPGSEVDTPLATMTELAGAEAQRARLAALLGGHGATPFRLVGRTAIAVGSDAWRADRLTLAGPDGERVEGILSGPPGPWRALPGVLYCHAHGNRYAMGASELIESRPALLDEPYGPALARAGCVALAIDMPCFGARAHLSESALSKALLWRGGTLFGAMLRDLAGALDVLAAIDGIDARRLGAFGFSMGATHAFWLGALEPRLGRVAHACAFADLETLIGAGAHDLHGHYMTVPGLCSAFRTGEIAGLVAPRPQLAIAGVDDPLTPPEALAAGIADLKRCYAAAGAEAALAIQVDATTGHKETAAMREAVVAFLAAP
jgi:dienelactone hydrolase